MFGRREENDLITDWYRSIRNNHRMYEERLLDHQSLTLLKLVCECLEQNTQVFILSVEIAEKYIRKKNDSNEKIMDPLLVLATIAFISHKYDGAPDCLKIKHIVDILFYITNVMYSPHMVAAMECDILLTLEGNLPVTTIVDDVGVIVEKYMYETRLRADIGPLGLKLIEFVYLERHQWYEPLKLIYSNNNDTYMVFHHLLSSQLYLPVCIFIITLQITNYCNILDVDAIIGDISKTTSIHPDHIYIFVSKIIELIV